MEYNNLVLKRPSSTQAPLLMQIVVGIVVSLPLCYLFWLWRKDEPLHWASPIATMISGVILVVIPILVTVLFLWNKIEFANALDQKTIGVHTLASRLTQVPVIILGALFLSSAARDMLAHPEAIFFPIEQIVHFEVITTVLLLLCGIIFFRLDEARLSPDGMWMGMLRFVPWSDISALVITPSQADVYHRLISHVPLWQITFSHEKARVWLEKAASDHQIMLRPSKNPWLWVSAGVSILVGLTILSGGLWAYHIQGYNACWILWGALAVQYLRDKLFFYGFGLHRVPMQLPMIEPLREITLPPFNNEAPTTSIAMTLHNGWVELHNPDSPTLLTLSKLFDDKSHIFTVGRVPVNSTALSEAQPDGLWEEALQIGQKHGWERLTGSSRGQIPFGAYGAASFERLEEPGDIRIWVLSNGKDAILATHIASPSEDPSPAQEVQGMLHSLTLTPPGRS